MAVPGPLAEAPRLPAGLQDRYEIHREVGRGASGVVYLGHDIFKQRPVAIKVAHPSIFGDSEDSAITRKTWLNEVHIAGSLKHPYIVEVFDAGITPETAWLVMEYLPNGTLDPFTRPDTLKPIQEILEIIYKCASALDYACRNGIIHRDIKPANLQYIGPGEVKVGDFGAAYWTKEDSTQVMDIGSVAYMAPELFRSWVTPQADIYALGAVLFKLLTGRLPFVAENQAALMHAIMNDAYPPLRRLRPDLPVELEMFVGRMLARSLEDRFPNWNEVLKALTGILPQLRTAIPADAAPGKLPAHAEAFERLRSLPLFEDLSDAHLWELLRLARWFHLPKGTVLVREGAPAKSCYVLLEGEAKVTQQSKLLNWIAPGSLFGELALAEKTPSARAATVTAESSVTIGKWPYASLLSASPELQTRLLKIFFRLAAERLRHADEQYLMLYRQHMKENAV